MSVNTKTENGVIRELAIRRMEGGGTVALYWSSKDQEISLKVECPGDEFTVRKIPWDCALDALEHPYAYAALALNGKGRPS